MRIGCPTSKRKIDDVTSADSNPVFLPFHPRATCGAISKIGMYNDSNIWVISIGSVSVPGGNIKYKNHPLIKSILMASKAVGNGGVYPQSKR